MHVCVCTCICCHRFLETVDHFPWNLRTPSSQNLKHKPPPYIILIKAGELVLNAKDCTFINADKIDDDSSSISWETKWMFSMLDLPAPSYHETNQRIGGGNSFQRQLWTTVVLPWKRRCKRRTTPRRPPPCLQKVLENFPLTECLVVTLFQGLLRNRMKRFKIMQLSKVMQFLSKFKGLMGEENTHFFFTWMKQSVSKIRHCC